MSMWDVNRLENKLKERKPEIRPNVDYVPTTLTLNTGTATGGAVANVREMHNGLTYDVDEVTGVPGYSIDFHFTGVTKNPRFVTARFLYNGLSTHHVGILLWDYSDSAWRSFRVFTDTGGYYENVTSAIPLDIASNYRNAAGEAEVRIYHYTSGNSAHDIMIDYIGLTH